MKKHITIIALALVAIAAAFCSCGKDDNQGNNDQPIVVQKEYKIHYALKDQYTKGDTIVIVKFTPCFKANVAYLDANGDTIKLTDVTLPWEKDITVTGPFNAYIKGNEYYDQSELPENVTFGYYAGFTVQETESKLYIDKGYSGVCSKDNFLENLSTIENTLKFTCEYHLE